MRKSTVLALLTTLTLSVGLIAGVAEPAASAVEWHYMTLDGSGSVSGHLDADIGSQSASATVNGVDHVFYARIGDQPAVRHAWRENGTWFAGGIEPLAGRSFQQFTALAVGSTLHVFYWDATTNSLRHATLAGGKWTYEYVDGASASHAGRTQHHVGSSAKAVFYDGTYHVFYYDETAHSLRHAWKSGNTWSYEWVDGPIAGTPGRTTQYAGREISAVVDSTGKVRLAYSTVTTAAFPQPRGLRYANRVNGAWKFKTLDGPGSNVPGNTASPVGSHPTIIMNGGLVNVFYQETTAQTVRRASVANAAWSIEVLDGVWSTIPNHTNSAVGFAGISAIAKNGVIRVFYDKAGSSTKTLRQAVFNNGWSYRMLEGADGNSGTGISYAGLTPAATFEGGNPVVYYGAYEGLRQTLRRAELY